LLFVYVCFILFHSRLSLFSFFFRLLHLHFLFILFVLSFRFQQKQALS
jgi:hypothetical protein